METELNRDPIKAGALVVTRMDTQGDQGLIIPAGTQGIVTIDYGKALEVQFIGYDAPMTVNSFNMRAVSNIPVDPIDWRARALKSEAALNRIHQAALTPSLEFYRTHTYNVECTSYEQWFAQELHAAIESVWDVVKGNQDTTPVTVSPETKARLMNQYGLKEDDFYNELD